MARLGPLPGRPLSEATPRDLVSNRRRLIARHNGPVERSGVGVLTHSGRALGPRKARHAGLGYAGVGIAAAWSSSRSADTLPSTTMVASDRAASRMCGSLSRALSILGSARRTTSASAGSPY